MKRCVRQNLLQNTTSEPLIITFLKTLWTGNVALLYAQSEQHLWQKFTAVWWQNQSCSLLQSNSLHYSPRNAGNERTSAELKNVLSEVVKIINSVKVSPLNSHWFSLTSEDVGSSNRAVSAAYRGRLVFARKIVVSSVWTSAWIVGFCSEEINCDWEKLFKNKNWITKLAYMRDTLSILNFLNTSFQGQMSSVFRIADKNEGF
jgi:hypothetical protein